PASWNGKHRVSLLVAQSLHRVEFRGPSSRIESRHEADKASKPDGKRNQPQRHSPEVLRRNGLALEINVGSKINHLTDRPAKHNSDDPSGNSHCARLGEEQFLYVAVTGSD